MLNIPLLKFEKNTTYLKKQLDIQENNKQLILDIIANIGLILNTSSNNNKESFETVLESANEFLKNISSNITIIEQLNLEISNITKELTEVLSEQNKTSKTKEFYIASFSNIKHNMSQYIEKFQTIEKKLDSDNNDFNEFININNFKYNFESIENSEKSNSNTYEFTGFSINDQEISSKDSISKDSDSIKENEQIIDENIESVKKIDELTNNFKELLTGLSTGNKEVKDVFDFVKTSLEVETSNLENSSNSEESLKNTIEDSTEEIISNNSAYEENNFDTMVDITEEITDDDLFSALIENSEIELENTLEEDINENSENTIIEDIKDEKIENVENIEDEFLEDTDFSVDMDAITSTPIKKKKIKYSGDAVANYAKNLYSPNISMEDYISNEYDLFEITDPKYKIEKKQEEPLLPKLGNIKNEKKLCSDFTEELDDEILEEILESDDLLNVEDNIEIEIEKNVNINTKPENSEAEENLEPSPFLKQSIDIFDNIDEYEEIIIEDEEYDDKLDYYENDLSDSELEENSDDIIENPDLALEEYSDEIIENSNSEIEEDLPIPEKIEKIKEASSDNETLIISENTNKVYLPYKISELVKYVEAYPDVYTSLSDVVEQEFILPFDYFIKHPYKSRFFETYNLIRNRAGYSVLTALKFSLKLIYKTNLNPVIIAACKTQTELKSLLYHLDADDLREFKYFNIVFDVNPLVGD